eukprot:c13284_g1_i1 orf=554-1204(-)
MSKLPSFTHRSVSVREQREQVPPQFQRSVSAYRNEDAEAPVEIGSKGSIFSLVGRDITMQTAGGVTETSKNVSNYVWLNRLWIIPRKANASHRQKEAKRATNATRRQKEAKLTTVVESIQEKEVPKWKRFIKKLKEGSNIINLNAKRRDGSSSKNDSRTCTTKLPLTRPSPPLRTSISPTCPIWERRDFVQVSPLDLSHLQTIRLKKQLARSTRHN